MNDNQDSITLILTKLLHETAIARLQLWRLDRDYHHNHNYPPIQLSIAAIRDLTKAINIDLASLSTKPTSNQTPEELHLWDSLP